MEALHSYHANLIRQVTDTFFRFIYKKINWNQRMLAIRGPRGSGKTTLMLQYLKYDLGLSSDHALYISADHHWFYTHTLFEAVETFYQNGGRHLFVDEVHKYPNWSRELKNIYDGFPDLKIVFSASSALDIYRGEADLSRRVISYELSGMSFREFLMLTENVEFPPVTLDELVNEHQFYADKVSQEIHPLPHFRNYLTYGYLPIIAESIEAEIPIRLNQVINTVLESDLAYAEGYDGGTAHKIKKLLGVVAESVPFKPNISALSRKLDISRDSVYTWLTYLEKARLLNFLKQRGKGTSTLQKPDKIYLENTNLAYALKENPDTGSLRESFLLNQLINSGHNVTLPPKGDFEVDGLVIEVGGKNKSFEQVKDLPKYVVAADDIESGYSKKIPLWLFGFLY